MKKIPVVVVDDEAADRYIVKRRLSKTEDFGEVIEESTGDAFLRDYFNGSTEHTFGDAPILVLMDINMPGLSGFETIEEVQKRMAAGIGPKSIVVMMFTSSNNPDDRARAAALDIVKGYFVKPLDEQGIEKLRSAYYA